ncbi:MAG TPA: hypothetical protein VLJ39_14785 [Tepidisphaeraceae bacterium]|jgi:hypothetical protein|nr:hypothetical protein [Tepidisphaeraceae bacterium]
MQTSRRTLLSGLGSAGALAAVGAMSGLMSGSSVSAQSRREERQYPKIHSALDALRAAREELSSAGDDFHGHKAEAMKAVDAAIQQLEALVANHPH